MIQFTNAAAPKVLFAQLPIPPAGPAPIHGNVPLAAGYLILHARSRGLDKHFHFEILPPKICNYHSDLGIVEEILAREPGIVDFSCYLWNIDRTLWIASHLKRLRPELVIVLGGRKLIPGLWRATNPQVPLFRKPIANLDDVSSPYASQL